MSIQATATISAAILISFFLIGNAGAGQQSGAQGVQTNVGDVLDRAEELFYAGQLDRADSLLHAEIRKRQTRANSGGEVARLMVLRGKILSTRSFITNKDYDKALAVNQEAAKRAASQGEERLSSNALTFAGLASYARTYNEGGKNYDTAFALFTRGANIRYRSDDKRGIAESAVYLGIIHERYGRIDSAKVLYNMALDISTVGGFKLEESYATRHLAFIRQGEGDLQGALEYFKRSLSLREEIGFKVYLPFSYLSVGTVYDQLEEFENALSFYQKAYATAKEVAAPRVEVLAALNIGELYKRQGQLDNARGFYEKALSIATELDYTKGRDYATGGLAELDSLKAER